MDGADALRRKHRFGAVMLGRARMPLAAVPIAHAACKLWYWSKGSAGGFQLNAMRIEAGSVPSR